MTVWLRTVAGLCIRAKKIYTQEKRNIKYKSLSNEITLSFFGPAQHTTNAQPASGMEWCRAASMGRWGDGRKTDELTIERTDTQHKIVNSYLCRSDDGFIRKQNQKILFVIFYSFILNYNHKNVGENPPDKIEMPLLWIKHPIVHANDWVLCGIWCGAVWDEMRDAWIWKEPKRGIWRKPIGWWKRFRTFYTCIFRYLGLKRVRRLSRMSPTTAAEQLKTFILESPFKSRFQSKINNKCNDKSLKNSCTAFVVVTAANIKLSGIVKPCWTEHPLIIHCK